GRNRSVDPPARRPPRARCAPAAHPLGLSGRSGATPKAIRRRRTTEQPSASVSGSLLRLPRLHLRVHALTIHIEVPEFGRGQATLERLLFARRRLPALERLIGVGVPLGDPLPFGLEPLR